MLTHQEPSEPIPQEQDRNQSQHEQQKESSKAPITIPKFSLLTEADPTKPRLIIRKMVCFNFKSYAGRQEVGPFHQVYFLSNLISFHLILICLYDFYT